MNSDSSILIWTTILEDRSFNSGIGPDPIQVGCRCFPVYGSKEENGK